LPIPGDVAWAGSACSPAVAAGGFVRATLRGLWTRRQEVWREALEFLAWLGRRRSTLRARPGDSGQSVARSVVGAWGVGTLGAGQGWALPTWGVGSRFALSGCPSAKCAQPSKTTICPIFATYCPFGGTVVANREHTTTTGLGRALPRCRPAPLRRAFLIAGRGRRQWAVVTRVAHGSSSKNHQDCARSMKA
jgi:hypothetical protein